MDRAPEQASARGADNRPDGPVAPAVEFAAEKRTRGRADDEPGRPIVAAAVITAVVGAPDSHGARQAPLRIIVSIAVKERALLCGLAERRRLGGWGGPGRRGKHGDGWRNSGREK